MVIAIVHGVDLSTAGSRYANNLGFVASMCDWELFLTGCFCVF